MVGPIDRSPVRARYAAVEAYVAEEDPEVLTGVEHDFAVRPLVNTTFFLNERGDSLEEAYDAALGDSETLAAVEEAIVVAENLPYDGFGIGLEYEFPADGPIRYDPDAADEPYWAGRADPAYGSFILQQEKGPWTAEYPTNPHLSIKGAALELQQAHSLFSEVLAERAIELADQSLLMESDGETGYSYPGFHVHVGQDRPAGSRDVKELTAQIQFLPELAVIGANGDTEGVKSGRVHQEAFIDKGTIAIHAAKNKDRTTEFRVFDVPRMDELEPIIAAAVGLNQAVRDADLPENYGVSAETAYDPRPDPSRVGTEEARRARNEVAAAVADVPRPQRYRVEELRDVRQEIRAWNEGHQQPDEDRYDEFEALVVEGLDRIGLEADHYVSAIRDLWARKTAR